MVGETSFIIEYYKKNNNLFYNSKQADLLQDVFRHKVVHLAKPDLLKVEILPGEMNILIPINHLKMESLS
ncbi:MAG: hypothetical protein WBE34_12765 [Candidatus Nitrosopolaris sp.]